MPASSSFLQSFLEPVLGRWLYADSSLWTVVGFLGAAIFGSRFVLQWLKSEKEKKLVVPWYFWHLSFWGSVLNLLYFLHLDKAPLILGNCFLPFLYGRNILFLRAGGEKGRGRLVFAAVVVLTIIGLIISRFMGTGPVPRDLQAMNEISAMVTGLKSYQKEFGTPASGESREIFGALLGKNAKQMKFMEASELSSDGEPLDPWGQAYRLFVSGKSFLIRCAGPNGAFDEGREAGRDDIVVEGRLD